jgi:hypothetical protein
MFCHASVHAVVLVLLGVVWFSGLVFFRSLCLLMGVQYNCSELVLAIFTDCVH